MTLREEFARLVRESIQRRAEVGEGTFQVNVKSLANTTYKHMVDDLEAIPPPWTYKVTDKILRENGGKVWGLRRRDGRDIPSRRIYAFDISTDDFLKGLLGGITT